MAEALQAVGLVFLNGFIAFIFIAIVISCLWWTFVKGPFWLQAIAALVLFGLLVIGPIVGLFYGTSNPANYYDDRPYSGSDRYN